jgi:hypothetical protein
MNMKGVGGIATGPRINREEIGSNANAYDLYQVAGSNLGSGTDHLGATFLLVFLSSSRKMPRYKWHLK